ncbi:hypothetical protein AC578_4854 [Pseudocercospora eumusae]|uniref:Glycosyl transferase CAP10 domain-containing protein n=1 Tax=Pseudocercospora eumusae TaxID=321146 RepID=A0A139HC26_9PEZI|nr:hypothetical protein AC578_4854 [Pseudocercospora eumusae]
MESCTKWKRTIYIVIGLIILSLLFLSNENLRDAATPTFSAARILPWNKLPKGLDGEYIDNLSDAQCDHAFPDLYHEIDRATSYWKQRNHNITQEDVSISWFQSAFRLLIHKNQIRILESKNAFGSAMSRARCMDIIFLLHRALESATSAGEILPTVELAFTIPDITEMPNDTTHTALTWNRRINDTNHERHWMIPNFSMWRGDGDLSYPESRLAAKKQDLPFAKKIPKLVWRGAVWVNHVRSALVHAAKDKPWADIEKVAGEDGKEFYLSNDELCKYAMTVHTEGISYSARLDWLIECNSLLFIHELEWDMWYYHLLKSSGPEQNFVAVRRDFGDLEDKVKYYFEHPDEAERLIRNSIETFRDRYLTRAAVSCYFRKLIRGYAEVAFVPEVQRTDGRLLRGLSYEMFMIGVKDFGDKDS